MSYSFGMYFKQLNSKNEVFDVILQVKNLIYENRLDILRNNRFAIPSQQTKRKNEADFYWLYSVMQGNMVYWDKYKLLGILGYNLDFLNELFPVHITFQNSTDQDYEYSEWGSGIPLFDELRKKAKVLTPTEIIEAQLERYGNEEYCVEEESLNGNIEYYRKSELYNMIYNFLCLDQFLYDNPCDEFERFAINPIDSFEKHMECDRTLKVVIKEINDEFGF